MYPRHPTDGGQAMSEADLVRAPWSEVMHVLPADPAGQIRGEPWLTRVPHRLKEVEDATTPSSPGRRSRPARRIHQVPVLTG